MDLYELDGWLGLRILNDDDKVGTLFFPTLDAYTTDVTCYLYSCTKSSREGPFKTKKSGSTTSVSASAAIQITGATYIDELGQCCDPLTNPGCQQ